MTKLTLDIDLPHDPEFEAQALGTALSGRGGYGALAALEPDDFHDALNRSAWAVVEAIGKAGREPDLMTVDAELKAAGVKPEAMADLREAAGNRRNEPIDPVSVVSRLKGLAMKRRGLWALHGLAEDLQSRSYSVVAEDQIGMAVSTLSGLSKAEHQFVTLAEIGDDYLRKERTPVSSTGFPNLDTALAGGFHQNRVYGFSGKMKAGKTMFMCSMSYNMVTLGIPHAYLCLEMRPQEIGQRYYARRMGVNSLDFYDEHHRNSPKFIRKLIEAKAYFEDKACLSFKAKPRMDLETLRATIAQIALSGKYRGVFVDYAQLVGGQARNQNEVNHLDNVCQTLAEMAATYPLWIVVGAQQNDDGGVRGGKGLAAACDVLFALDNSDPDDTPFVDSSGRRERRHLTMQFSRYTMATDIGAPNDPGYILRADAGPYFEELR
jgi:replicative DNA helicase